jgi:hypothetical protein
LFFKVKNLGMQSTEIQTEAKANHPTMSWHFHSVTHYTPEGIYSGVDGTLWV